MIIVPSEGHYRIFFSSNYHKYQINSRNVSPHHFLLASAYFNTHCASLACSYFLGKIILKVRNLYVMLGFQLHQQQKLQFLCIIKLFPWLLYANHIDDVMVNVFTCGRLWVRVPVGSNQRQSNLFCCFSATLLALRGKEKIGWLGIMITCPSGATCLPADYRFRELAL